MDYWRLCKDCGRQSMIAGSVVIAAALGGVAVITLVLCLAFRFIDPPASSLMISQMLSGRSIDHRWVPIERMSPNLIRAVVQSEDARFCSHSGIDLIELEAAARRSKSGDLAAIRGASTISMQVVKNLFLWPDRSLARKGLEMVMTPVMEFVWPKRRILEIYLNVAEWGPGIFGAEAAARRHFGKPANRLTRREAALLAAALPNPRSRRPARPNRFLRKRAGRIARSAGWRGLDLRCVQG